jgi:ABC-2 type transport system permease protein
MFKEIFLFELKSWFKRPAIYLYFMLYLVGTFLLICAATGAFTGNTQDTNSYMNSASSIASILNSFNSDFFLGLITTIICVSIMGSCVQKDYQFNIHSLFYSKPIAKSSYLLGRFSASFLLSLFTLSGIIFGLILGFAIAPNDNGQIGPFSILNYLVPFLTFTVINVFFIGVTFFSLVTYTRNLTTGYVSALVFIVISGIASSMTSDLDNETLAAIIDPFGNQALSALTEYWTPSEQNERMVPLQSYVLYNRVFWLSVSLIIGFFTYRNFKFSQFLSPVSLKKKKAQSESKMVKHIQFLFQLPKAKQYFDLKTSLQQLKFLTRFEIKKIVRSVFFAVVIGVAILLMVVQHNFQDLFYGTETYPVTYQMLDLGAILSQFFLIILIIFYSGIVVWRERDNKCDELIYSTPVQTWVLFTSKFLSLVGLVAAVYGVAILTSIALQTYEGYFNYELGLYIFEYYGKRIFTAIVLCAMATMVQVLVNNKFIGFTLTTLLTFGLQIIYNSADINNKLIIFNSSGSVLPYSDMNGYGHSLYVFYIYKAYWIGFMMMLVALSMPMWPRLKEKNYKARINYAKKQFQRSYAVVAIIGLVIFLSFGSFIYYNTRVLNEYKTSKQQEKEQLDFEKKYKICSKDLQPRIVSSSVEVDIFPNDQGAKVKGYYYLKNKHKQALTKIYVGMYEPKDIKEIKLQAAHKKEIDDNDFGFYSYKLAKPMMPGDSIRLDFTLEHYSHGFSESGSSTEIVDNGTFFNSSALPYIGYNDNLEIGDNSTRKKYDLKPKPRTASIDDTTAYANTYIAKDADWIRFEATVSTIPSQIAIAPGYLEKEWESNGRKYFKYKMDKPILNFYSFLSAEYSVLKDKWINPNDPTNVVNIEIYYHKDHTYNLDRMVNSTKKSLNYYTANFSPYQHKQVRIIEFPRYASFAQSFPNTIPYSESIGFIAKVDSTDQESIDFPFYVTAHEIAHQWWAHQIIGADVQGSTLMSETMSQYSALMVMEKEYGKPAMKKFLKYEMDRYLMGRAQESRKEVPLMLVENQQYIHYNKGSMIMYSLKDYMGEDSLNLAMKRYLKDKAFQEPPYTTAKDFYSQIKQSTPDSLKETLMDLFERIVVFDNKVRNVTVQKVNNKFKVTMLINAGKTKSDSLGKAKDVMVNDWIDVGVFAKNARNKDQLGKELVFKKYKIVGKEQKIELTLAEEPFMVGIDPYNKLIDLDPEDNVKACQKSY